MATSTATATAPAGTGSEPPQPAQRQHQAARGTLGHPAVLVDDRAAGDDLMVLVPVLQPARPDLGGFAGWENYTYLLTDPSLWTAMINTLYLVFWVLVITVGLGTLLAVLFDQEFYGRGVARLFAIAPFFVMPTVAALVWKNMLMHPVNGLFASMARSVGLPAIDFFGALPLTSVIIIVAWQWLPFALLILLTAIQSLDHEQKEAARMDGAGPFSMFFFIILPHLAGPSASSS